jgi:hypothetical protein
MLMLVRAQVLVLVLALALALATSRIARALMMTSLAPARLRALVPVGPWSLSVVWAP